MIIRYSELVNFIDVVTELIQDFNNVVGQSTKSSADVIKLDVHVRIEALQLRSYFDSLRLFQESIKRGFYFNEDDFDYVKNRVLSIVLEVESSIRTITYTLTDNRNELETFCHKVHLLEQKFYDA